MGPKEGGAGLITLSGYFGPAFFISQAPDTEQTIHGGIMEWEIVFSAVIQSLLEFLLPILAVALISMLLSWARLLWAKAKNWNDSSTDLLAQAVRVAVMAAEQAGMSKLIDDKREYAFEIAEEWLKSRGINLDSELIYGAIEAAVYKEFNSQKEVQPKLIVAEE